MNMITPSRVNNLSKVECKTCKKSETIFLGTIDTMPQMSPLHAIVTRRHAQRIASRTTVRHSWNHSVALWRARMQYGQVRQL